MLTVIAMLWDESPLTLMSSVTLGMMDILSPSQVMTARVTEGSGILVISNIMLHNMAIRTSGNNILGVRHTINSLHSWRTRIC